MATSKDNSAKEAIKAYLDRRAAADAQFAAVYAKPHKNIDECFSYILGEARRRGREVCMTDEEVFGLAVHYYDEDDIKVKPAPRVLSASAAPAAPQTIELTPEEKATAREAAKREYERLCLEEEALESKARRKAPKKKASPQFDQQPSLFDFD